MSQPPVPTYRVEYEPSRASWLLTGPVGAKGFLRYVTARDAAEYARWDARDSGGTIDVFDHQFTSYSASSPQDFIHHNRHHNRRRRHHNRPPRRCRRRDRCREFSYLKKRGHQKIKEQRQGPKNPLLSLECHVLKTLDLECHLPPGLKDYSSYRQGYQKS